MNEHQLGTFMIGLHLLLMNLRSVGNSMPGDSESAVDRVELAKQVQDLSDLIDLFEEFIDMASIIAQKKGSIKKTPRETMNDDIVKVTWRTE